MVRVSSSYAEDDVFEETFDALAEALTHIGTKTGGRTFLRELLGYDEQVMLAKRYTGFLLLLDKYSTTQITDLLNISDSTAKRFRNDLKKRETPYLTFLLEKSKKKKKLWSSLEDIARAGLPPQGKGRLKWLYRHFDAEEQ